MQKVPRVMFWLAVSLLLPGCGGGGGEMVYNIACAYAQAGDAEKALDYLSKVLLVGFASKEWVENDGDLISLHGYPRFQELLDQMDSSE